MAELRRQREIVRDDEHRDPLIALQSLQQRDDLHGHQRVERRGRLVEHQHLGLGHQRAGDGDALRLATRQPRRCPVS